MSKIKKGWLDQYGTESFEQSSLQQLVLKGLRVSTEHLNVKH